MKRTLFACILVLLLLLTLLPAALAQESQPAVTLTSDQYFNVTVTVDGTPYRLSVGRKVDGQYRSLLYSNTIHDPQEKSYYDSYVLLVDGNQQDAPESAYRAFWASCDVEELQLSNQENAEIGSLTTEADGYHKYFPVTFTGATGGFCVLRVNVKSSGETVWAYSLRYSVTVYEAQGFYTRQTAAEQWRVTDQVNWYELPGAEGNRKVLWYLKKNGITETEMRAMSVRLDNRELDIMEWVRREGTNTYDLKLLLPESSTFYWLTAWCNGTYQEGIRVDMRVQSQTRAAYVDDLVIGFRQTMFADSLDVILENGYLFGRATDANSGDGSYRDRVPITILAARKTVEGEDTVYEVDSDVTKSLQIAKLEILPIRGEPTAFSLSEASYVPVQEALPATGIYLHNREGLTSAALVRATVTGTVKGTPFTVTVQAGVELTLANISVGDRPSWDTVEALNADLLALATEDAAGSAGMNIHHIFLAPTVYEGTIVIPAKLSDKCIFHLNGTGGRTVVEGGIDLNHGQRVERIDGIHFRAPEAAEGETTRAIWGGDVSMVMNCSFRGYDVAVDAGDGVINLSAGSISDVAGNVFADNDVAVRLDVDDSDSGMRLDWKGNTFVRNGTAVEVLSLQTAKDPEYGNLSPYYFRILDSNFIGNTLDFDMQHSGRYYMYRNYYAKVHPDAEKLTTAELLEALQAATTDKATQQLVTSNSPEIRKANNKTKVITNPRWKYPVQGWWTHSTAISDVFGAPTAVRAMMAVEAETEPAYENILTIWWSEETEILNGMASQLPINTEAFVGNAVKTVDVLADETEELLGIWTFPGQAAAAAVQAAGVPDFDAGLTLLAEGQTVSVTVTDSEVLAQWSPTLTVLLDGTACSVTLDGKAVTFTADETGVSFPVSGGGTYVIEIEAPPDLAVTATAEDVDADIQLSVSIRSNAAAEKTCTVVAAAYDGSGQMAAVEMSRTITVAAGGQLVEPLTLKPEKPVETIRVFVLDGESSPLCEAIPVP